jgi:hypothetical protein
LICLPTVSSFHLENPNVCPDEFVIGRFAMLVEGQYSGPGAVKAAEKLGLVKQ